MPAQPPAPVITTFEVIDNGGMINMNIVWMWDGQGWPDDGAFGVYISSEDTQGETNAAAVPCPGRTCSLQGVLPAADISYYCRIVYVKNGTLGAFSAVATGNPY